VSPARSAAVALRIDTRCWGFDRQRVHLLSGSVGQSGASARTVSSRPPRAAL